MKNANATPAALSDKELDAVAGGSRSDLGQQLQFALQEANNVTRSDLGQKLQFQLQEANNIYTRSR